MDNIEQLFDRIKGTADIAEPSADHQANFLAKLQAQQQETAPAKVRKLNWWKPLLIAASLLLIAGLVFTQGGGEEDRDLADVSPEMEQTQSFFTNAIEKELFEIQKQASPETQGLVDDALERMNSMEEDYAKLKEDLVESGDDQRVIYAMINNFQNRIDLLQQVLEHMDAIKNLNELKPATL